MQGSFVRQDEHLDGFSVLGPLRQAHEKYCPDSVKRQRLFLDVRVHNDLLRMKNRHRRDAAKKQKNPKENVIICSHFSMGKQYF